MSDKIELPPHDETVFKVGDKFLFFLKIILEVFPNLSFTPLNL